jgi:hypothetical protein
VTFSAGLSMTLPFTATACGDHAFGLAPRGDTGARQHLGDAVAFGAVGRGALGIFFSFGVSFIKLGL